MRSTSSLTIGRPLKLADSRTFDRPTNASGPMKSRPRSEARQLHHRAQLRGARVQHGEGALAGLEHPQPVAVPARRVRHRKTTQEYLARTDVQQHAAVGLVGAPAAHRVGFAERRDVARSAVAHCEAVQVAAIFRCVRRHERRTPARMEAVLDVERAKAREARVHQPEPGVVGPRHLVNVDVAGEVDAAQCVTRIVPAGRFEPGGGTGHVVVLPHGVRATDGETAALLAQPHRSIEGAEMRVQRNRRPGVVPARAVRANEDHAAGLIGRDEQAAVQASQDPGEVARVHTGERVRSRDSGVTVSHARLEARS
jgi:hypothetical protein